jgi:lysylphosphatidylglycerol synthetase-like protein (DUF2156 family)
MDTRLSSQAGGMPRRPTGITVLSLWNLLWGIAFVWVFLLGLPLLLLGYGLWKLKGWAWWASVLFAGLQILVLLPFLLDEIRWTTLPYLSLASIVLVYLCSQPIRQAFGQQGMRGLPRGLGSGLLWLAVTTIFWFVAFAFLEVALSRPLGG